MQNFELFSPTEVKSSTSQQVNRALQCHQAGQLEEAESIYRQLVTQEPSALVCSHLGLLLAQQNQWEEAIDCYTQALNLDPDNSQLYTHIANALFAQGNFDAAEKNYRQALTLNPDKGEFYYNLANTLQHQRKFDEAIELYYQAVCLNPDHAEAYYNLGVALQAQDQLSYAVISFQEVLRLKPNHIAAHYNLASILQAQGRLEDAIVSYQKVLELDPNLLPAWVALGSVYLQIGHFFGLENIRASLSSAVDQLAEEVNHWSYLNLLAYFFPFLSLDPKVEHKITQRISTLLAKHNTDLFHANTYANKVPVSIRTEKRIKIAYLSPNFGNHSIGHVTCKVFTAHSHSDFEVFGYSTKDRSQNPGNYYQDIKNGCDHFNDVSSLSALDLAERIYQDGIDILVDLTGYMENHRLEALSFRPAPIQVYWLGHGGGLGLDFIDYVIADPVTIPPSAETDYVEKIARLPEVFAPADTPPISTKPLKRKDFNLAEDSFIFCVFNNPQKIDINVFSSWMRILNQVSGSQLWFSNVKGYTSQIKYLQSAAEHFGIDPERLVFSQRVEDKSVHFARHQLADLFLDTFTVNAATTAIDALWAGLPVLTYLGNTFHSRIGASLVTAIEMPDMICYSRNEYEQRAIALAYNPNDLQAIRDRLWHNRLTAPLFDTSRFVKHLEQAYRTIWQHYMSGESPTSFTLSTLPK